MRWLLFLLLLSLASFSRRCVFWVFLALPCSEPHNCSSTVWETSFWRVVTTVMVYFSLYFSPWRSCFLSLRWLGIRLVCREQMVVMIFFRPCSVRFFCSFVCFFFCSCARFFAYLTLFVLVSSLSSFSSLQPQRASAQVQVSPRTARNPSSWDDSRLFVPHML